MAGQAILTDALMGIMAKSETGKALESDLDIALEQIVREYARFVFRVAYSILRNRDDAEDAAQEVFLRVLKYKSKLADVRDRKVWLARITWRVSLCNDRVGNAQQQSDAKPCEPSWPRELRRANEEPDREPINESSSERGRLIWKRKRQH
jgi:RNA polymerase sigma-70 factor (ECF subfamily)